ncbi:MAG: hypothetical protein ACR2JC_11315 [Chloroflexota bacterium]
MPLELKLTHPVYVAAITLQPASGGFGTSVQVTGASFRAGETVKVYWNATGTPPVATTIANSTGAVETSFGISLGSLGNHQVIAVGQSSHRQAAATFQITPAAFLKYSSGKKGSSNTVTVYGFAAREKVSVHWNSASGTLLGSAVTSSPGTATITFRIPSAPPATYHIYAIGGSSKATASAPFRIHT